MGNLKLLTTVLFLSLALGACGDKGGSADNARSHGGDPREFRGDVDISQTGNSSQNISWGQIYDYNHGLNVANFQSRVEDFLSPQLDANQIGTVNGTFGNSNTGVFFYGRGISFSSTPSTNNEGFVARSNVFNKNTSELRIEVEDNFNGQKSVIPIHFNANQNNKGGLTDSYVEGKFIQVVFEDQFGKVSLEGEIFKTQSGELLYLGNVNYRNLARLREGGQVQTINESAKFLGGFSVNACRFFNTDQILGTSCSQNQN